MCHSSLARHARLIPIKLDLHFASLKRTLVHPVKRHLGRATVPVLHDELGRHLAHAYALQFAVLAKLGGDGGFRSWELRIAHANDERALIAIAIARTIRVRVARQAVVNVDWPSVNEESLELCNGRFGRAQVVVRNEDHAALLGRIVHLLYLAYIVKRST